ncbi:hypothetical protein DF16_pBMB293orf00044 (plasmid) [Bacillus thuringiensis serovar kurstaki str. YBT-1520]|nr:hypothetical protein DF16_pBMB293orf00044 [Bacillus thuringiensis serovar kurstaki str. YBT-1520]
MEKQVEVLVVLDRAGGYKTIMVSNSIKDRRTTECTHLYP